MHSVFIILLAVAITVVSIYGISLFDSYKFNRCIEAGGTPQRVYRDLVCFSPDIVIKID